MASFNRHRWMYVVTTIVSVLALALPALADHRPGHGGSGGGGKGGGGGGSVNFTINAFDTVSNSWTPGNVVRYAEGEAIPYRVHIAGAAGTVIDQIITEFDHRQGNIIGIEDLVPSQDPFSNDELSGLALCTGPLTADWPGAEDCVNVLVVAADAEPPADQPYAQGPSFEQKSGTTVGRYIWGNFEIPDSGQVTLLWGALLAAPDDDAGTLGASQWNGASLHHRLGNAVINGTPTSVGNQDVPIPVKQIISSSIDKTVNGLDALIGNDALMVGEETTVTLVVTTTGPRRESMTVTVKDILPSCLSYQNSATVNGSPQEPTITENPDGTRTLTWADIPVNLGDSVKVEFLVRAEEAGNCKNIGVVVPERGVEDEDEVDIDIEGAADLTIAKLCVAAAPGATTSHTVTFGNIGTADAVNVRIEDVLEAGLSYVAGSAELDGDEIVPTGSGTETDPLVFTIGMLPGGESAAAHTLTYDVEVASVGAPGEQELTNQVRIVSDSADADDTNNSASCGTTVVFAPDLAVSKTCPGSTPVGDAGSFTIVVNNIGSAAAGMTTVTDTLPAGLSYVPASASPPPSSITTNADGTTTIVWTFSSVPVGPDVTITFDARFDLAGNFSNSVVVQTAGDSDSSNNSDNCLAGGVDADVFVTKQCPETAQPGGQVMHTLRYGNTGNIPAENVQIVDVLSGGQAYVPGSATGVTPTVSGNTLTFDIGTLPAASGTRTITYLVSIPATQPSAGPATFTDQATISTSSPESDTSDNTSINCETTVDFRPVLQLSKSDCPGTVVPFGVLTYDITWSVGGSAPASSLVLQDTVPLGTSIVDADGGDVSGRTITWNLGDQPIGASGTQRIKVLVLLSSGTLTNTVTLDTPSIPGSPDKVATEQTTISLAGVNTTGEAYALDVELLGASLIDELAGVSTQAPPSPDAAGQTLIPLSIPGVLSADIVQTSSTSQMVPGAAFSTASSEVLNLNILLGAITADVVKGVSQSVATPFSASYASLGASFVDLRINGAPVGFVAPNTTVDIKNPLPLFTDTIARAVLLEEVGSSSSPGPGGPAGSASHEINMIHVTLVKPFLTLPAGAEIIVSHAGTTATYPSGVPCDGEIPGSVSGHAFTAFAQGTVAGVPVATGKIGEAVLPSTGGFNSDFTAAFVPGVVTSGTAANLTSGSLAPNPNATSSSNVENLNVLGGLVTANALDVSCASSATGTTAGTSFDFTFLDLRIDGNEILNPDIEPNTTIAIPQPGGALVLVVLNEQIVSGNGSTDTEGTINAIHVWVLKGSGVIELEVIVASAHCDAHTSG